MSNPGNDFGRQSGKIRCNLPVFDIIDDFRDIGDGGFGHVDNFTRKGREDVDDVSERLDGFLRKVLDEGWDLTCCQLGDKLFGLSDVGYESVDNVAGDFGDVSCNFAFLGIEKAFDNFAN